MFFGYLSKFKTFILLQCYDDNKYARKNNLSINEWKKIKKNIEKKIYDFREKRINPTIDDKLIAEWNGLMIKAIFKASIVFENKEYKELAIKALKSFKKTFIKNQKLYRIYREKLYIEAFSTDYIQYINANIEAFLSTSDLNYYNEAKHYTEKLINKFKPKDNFLLTLRNTETTYILDEIQNFETSDGVIPSVNSEFFSVINFFRKTEIDKNIKDICTKLNNYINLKKDNAYAGNITNWLNTMLLEEKKFYEIIVVGEKQEEIIRELKKYYIPNSILLGSNDKNSNFLLFKNRYINNKTLIYICKNNVCDVPLEDINLAINKLLIDVGSSR